MADKKLFFALWPDPRQAEILRNTISPIARLVEGNSIFRGNWHVTLVYIGPFPEQRVSELMERAAMIRPEAFRLRFDRLTFWQRPRIACLQAMTVPAPLQSVVDQINKVLADFNVELKTETYRPHITAVRNAKTFEPIVLARPLELQWSEFQLVEAISTRGEVQYCPLKQ